MKEFCTYFNIVLPELPWHLYHFLFRSHVHHSRHPLVTHEPHALSVTAFIYIIQSVLLSRCHTKRRMGERDPDCVPDIQVVSQWSLLITRINMYPGKAGKKVLMCVRAIEFKRIQGGKTFLKMQGGRGGSKR